MTIESTWTAAATPRVTRRPEKFIAEDRRVITRFFHIGGEPRIRSVLDRVMRLDESTVRQLLDHVSHNFSTRHRKVQETLQRNFREVQRYVDPDDGLTEACKLLIGSYFTMEYSIASAALFNPSIVPHPDQTNLQPGQLRYIMSLRATGEGHVSSIVFRTGIIGTDEQITLDPLGEYASILRQIEDQEYEKELFKRKLIEMGAYGETTRAVIEALPEFFTLGQLDAQIEALRQGPTPGAMCEEAAENMLWLAQSNYRLELPQHADPAEVVIFPTSENDAKGLEDLRLTYFTDDDGTVTYYGTFTAYNGYRTLPQLLETRDWHTIEIHTLNGRHVQNKGMALFPRKIDGLYYMISRLDGENIYLMWSDHPYFWNEATCIKAPHWPWELVQIGNCGPPIETGEGWVLLTHGVGPMRQYAIGAILLDLHQPWRVIGELPEPLLMPEGQEREGYVPNVVYSCGSLVHGRQLVIPYAMADRATSFATVELAELVEALKQHGPARADEGNAIV